MLQLTSESNRREARAADAEAAAQHRPQDNRSRDESEFILYTTVVSNLLASGVESMTIMTVTANMGRKLIRLVNYVLNVNIKCRDSEPGYLGLHSSSTISLLAS